jgi:hypothetical protein
LVLSKYKRKLAFTKRAKSDQHWNGEKAEAPDEVEAKARLAATNAISVARPSHSWPALNGGATIEWA